MKRVILCGALALAGCQNRGPQPGAAATGAPRTDDEKTFYALGAMMGERIGEFSLTPAELEFVKRGLTDQVNGTRPAVEVSQFAPRLGQLAQTRQTARAATEKTRGRQFADQAAREPGAQRLPSGLIYRELRAGNGPQPSASDTVTVNYRGTLINGTEFDSSYTRGQPATFPLRGVIPCWTEGVQKMHVGGKAKLVCPSDIAYGDHGQRRIPPGSTLTFEVELISIQPPAAPPGDPSMGGPPGGPPGGAPGGPPGGPRMQGPPGSHAPPTGATPPPPPPH